MSEPLADHLSRFTPDGSGLDRDNLFFAAGRASARPNRAWMGLAGMMAVVQVVMVLVLWPTPAPPIARRVADAPRETQAALVTEDGERPAYNPQVFLLPGGELPRAEPAESLVPDSPPLRAAALPSPD